MYHFETGYSVVKTLWLENHSRLEVENSICSPVLYYSGCRALALFAHPNGTRLLAPLPCIGLDKRDTLAHLLWRSRCAYHSHLLFMREHALEMIYDSYTKGGSGPTHPWHTGSPPVAHSRLSRIVASILPEQGGSE